MIRYFIYVIAGAILPAMAEVLEGVAAISYLWFVSAEKKVARNFPFPILFPHFVNSQNTTITYRMMQGFASYFSPFVASLLRMGH